MKSNDEDDVLPLKPDEVARLRQYFARFDYEGTGKVKLSDVDSLLRSLGITLTQPEFQDAIIQIGLSEDNHGSEELSLNMFLALWQVVSRLALGTMAAKDRLRLAFNVMDKTNTGTVSDLDLRNTLMQADFQLSTEALEDLVRAADINGDGQITFEALKFVLLGD